MSSFSFFLMRLLAATGSISDKKFGKISEEKLLFNIESRLISCKWINIPIWWGSMFRYKHQTMSILVMNSKSISDLRYTSTKFYRWVLFFFSLCKMENSQLQPTGGNKCMCCFDGRANLYELLYPTIFFFLSSFGFHWELSTLFFFVLLLCYITAVIVSCACNTN